jgi:hypothetical protein
MEAPDAERRRRQLDYHQGKGREARLLYVCHAMSNIVSCPVKRRQRTCEEKASMEHFSYRSCHYMKHAACGSCRDRQGPVHGQ